MKNRVLLVVGVIIGSLALPSIAGAADCTISHTGPGSNNSCTSSTTNSCTVNNNNNVTINNSNQQSGSSGSATSSGNTNGGSATSGSASNANSTNAAVTLNNSGLCAATTSVAPPTPTTPTTPTQPSGGSGGQVNSATTTAAAQSTQVQAPVGGVAAGAGGTDRSGVLVGLLGASVLAVGAGLRKLNLQKQT